MEVGFDCGYFIKTFNPLELHKFISVFKRANNFNYLVITND